MKSFAFELLMDEEVQLGKISLKLNYHPSKKKGVPPRLASKVYTVNDNIVGLLRAKPSSGGGDIFVTPGTSIKILYTNYPTVLYITDPTFPKSGDMRRETGTTFESIGKTNFWPK